MTLVWFYLFDTKHSIDNLIGSWIGLLFCLCSEPWSWSPGLSKSMMGKMKKLGDD